LAVRVIALCLCGFGLASCDQAREIRGRIFGGGKGGTAKYRC
jgi:hypothetical protein